MTAEEAANRLLTQPVIHDPHPDYRTLMAMGPAYRSHAGIVFVTGYDLGRDVLRHPGFEVSVRARMDSVWPDWHRHSVAAQLLDSMFGANPPEHQLQRDPFRARFSAQGVLSLEPALLRTVESHLDRLLAEPEADVMADFARPVAVDVVCDLLGIPARDRRFLETLVSDWTAALEPARGPKDLDRADYAVDAIRDYVRDLVDHRLAHPGPQDLVTAVLDSGLARRPQLLTANLAMLLAAGMETTGTLLGNAFLEILTDGEAADQCQADAGVVVEEVLRTRPPIHTASRVASGATRIKDFAFEPDDDVLVLLAACNRDPATFSRPDAFDWRLPRRRPLSFGGGLHHCLGALLARRTAVLALTAFATRRTRLLLAGPYRYRNRFVLNTLVDLPVRKDSP